MHAQLQMLENCKIPISFNFFGPCYFEAALEVGREAFFEDIQI